MNTPAWPVNATCDMLLGAKDNDDALLVLPKDHKFGVLEAHRVIVIRPWKRDRWSSGDGPGGRNAWSFQSAQRHFTSSRVEVYETSRSVRS